MNWTQSYGLRFINNKSHISSRGGLVVELWTDNSLPSASVGSNLLRVLCIRFVMCNMCNDD